jgi:hypothetical protein
LTQNGLILQCLYSDLKNDKEVVLAAVTEDEWALQFAHKDLRNDEYFLYEVNQIANIKTNDYVFIFLNERIRTEMRENPDYLLNFTPVYVKPAKK